MSLKLNWPEILIFAQNSHFCPKFTFFSENDFPVEIELIDPVPLLSFSPRPLSLPNPKSQIPLKISAEHSGFSTFCQIFPAYFNVLI